MAFDQTKQQMKKDLDTIRSDLHTMRDEIVVKMHLASMDIKDEWAKLEPKLKDAERYWSEVTDASMEAAGDLKKRFNVLRQKLAASKH